MLGSLVLGHKSDILAVHEDAAAIHEKAAGDSVKQGGLSRPVGAYDGDEVSPLQVEVHLV